MTWYTAEDPRKSVRQVVIEANEPSPVNSRFGVLRLDEAYRSLMTNFWAAGFFRLADDPGPYLLIRADGRTTWLKGKPFRVAFSFFHLKAGGLIGVFIDFPEPRVSSAPPPPHVLFETIRGIDLDDERGRIRDAINAPRLHLCFAEGEGPGEDLSSGLWAGTHIDALYDVLVDLDSPCRDALNASWTSLLEYHEGLPAEDRDFQASVRQMQAENPVSRNPVLDRPASTDNDPAADQTGSI